MCRRVWRLFMVLAMCGSLPAWSQETRPQDDPKNGGDFSDNLQPLTKVPTGVIMVKGAWSSASDSVTPMPESGVVTDGIFSNAYFGIKYHLPADWTQKYEGPPPSDSGRYVLAQIRPTSTFKGSARGSILITAQDMFFMPSPGGNVLEFLKYSRDNLQSDYKIEMQPTPTKVAGHSFGLFAYWSPAAELHWYVLETQLRCHDIEIVLTSRDTNLLKRLVLDLDKMQLPADAGPTPGAGGGTVPVCVKDYARAENLIARVDPILTEHRFNSVPVRIIIDEKGRVKHIHFLSAFPDQAKVISDALQQWRFKPCVRDGHPVEVETGIIFGRAPRLRTAAAGGNPATQ